MNKEYANNLKLKEIIMLGTNKISYAMLLTVILISVIIHTPAAAKDFNEKMGDLSVSAAQSFIAIQKGVENTEMLSQKTKEGLAALRNKRKLINDIAKKVGNKRYADQLNGAVRQLTKNITKMDSAFKKIGNSKIGKVSKQLTRGVGKKISVAENTIFWAEFAVKAKNLAQKENVSIADVANLGMDGFVRIADTIIPYSGTLTKFTGDNIKGIRLATAKLQDALNDDYTSDADYLDLLYKKEFFEARIKNPKYKAQIKQVSAGNDLQKIYSSILEDEFKQYEKVVKRIDESIERVQNMKLLPAKESRIKSLQSLKRLAETRLSAIKSGGDLENQLSDIFYLTAGSIMAEETDQQQKQTHDSINAQADQLAANKERILSIANQANESYNYDEYSPASLAALEQKQQRSKLKIRNQHKKQEINEKYKQKIQAERAAKRRQDQQRIKQKIERINQQTQAERAAKRRGAGRILSAADSLRLGGNYAYGTVAYRKRAISTLGSYRNQSAPLTKNGGNKSASLFFDGLEEVTSNSRKFSERVKASSAGYGDYNHTAWGAWSGDQNTRLNFSSGGLIGNVQGGYWVYGQRPGIADIPKSGSARYVGQLMGGWRPGFRDANAIGEMDSITGDIKMAVTFQDGNNSIFGSLNLKRSGKDWATASFNTLNARSAPNEKYRLSNHFSTLFSGGNLTGSFFGANAAEVGGNFMVSKGIGPDRGTAIGVFRAKNVGSIVGNISDTDRLKLLSGNYAVADYRRGWFYGAKILHDLNLPFINGSSSSSSLILRFSALKESIPNSDPTKGNTLVPSDRIKVHAKDYGDYSYIAWGSWSPGKNTRIVSSWGWSPATVGGRWIYGQRLRRADIPRSGSARYIGQVKGSSRGEMNSITGDINMAVTFRDNNLSLSGAMNLDRNGEDWATARFNDTDAISRSPGYDFGAKLKVVRVDGTRIGRIGPFISGSFFGANAAEVGGTFSVVEAHGVFRAKKQ